MEQASGSLLLACLAVAAVVCCLITLKLKGRRTAPNSRLPPPPPEVPGGVPLLGNALQLHKGGGDFLAECQRQLGDVFTLRLPPAQRMTFVLAPAALSYYFSAPDSELTFGPAVQQFTQRVFGLPSKHFYPKHLTMLQTLRHSLVPATMEGLGNRLLDQLLPQLALWPLAGQLELFSRLRQLVFESSVATLFGSGLLEQEKQQGMANGRHPRSGAQPKQECALTPDDPVGAGPPAAVASAPAATGAAAIGAASKSPIGQQETALRSISALQADFQVLDGSFEAAASPVPHAFQPAFRAARARLVAALRRAYESGALRGTVAEQLIQGCGLPQQYVPNMLLAVLWASQANTAPASFWALAFLLLPENRRHREAVEQQIRAAVAAAAAAGEADAGPEAGRAAEQRNLNGSGSGSGNGAGSESLNTIANSTQASAEALNLSPAQRAGLLAAACDRKGPLAAAVWEALRLRGFGIDVRIAASDVAIPTGDGRGALVSKGSVVALCPYLSHLDQRVFGPDAEAYNPARQGMQLHSASTAPAAAAAVDKGRPASSSSRGLGAEAGSSGRSPEAGRANGKADGKADGREAAPASEEAMHSVHSVVVGVGGHAGLSFGGGKYRCPGRYFAEMELCLLTGLLLTCFDWELLPREGAEEESKNVVALKNGTARADGAARRPSPGDPHARLPPPDMRKLVGTKVPAGDCWVQLKRRSAFLQRAGAA